MKILIFATLGAALLLANACLAQTAEEMVSSCKAISQAKVTGDEVEMPTDFDSGVCWGAFAMIQRMTRFTDHGQVIFGICAPSDSTRTQLIQVFEQYAIRHPERYHEHFWDVALTSLREAFPCNSSPH